MKKLFILFLIIFIGCGPSEEEIQMQIDEAVKAASESTTTTILQETTTTTSEIERIEWESTVLEIKGCPNPSELSVNSNYNNPIEINTFATLGDGLNKFTIDLEVNDEKFDSTEFSRNTDPTRNWDKGSKITFPEISFLLTQELYYFKYEITVFESAGSFSEVCEVKSDKDKNNLAPFAIFTNCPTTVKANSELELFYSVVARTDDISFVQFEFKDESRDKNFQDLILSDNLPQKWSSSEDSYITYPVGNLQYERNLSIIGTIYDTQNRSFKFACGTNLIPPPTTTTTLKVLKHKFLARISDGLFPESTVADIDGLRICLIPNTRTHGALIDVLDTYDPIVQLVVSDDITEAVQQFRSGECDLLFEDIDLLNDIMDFYVNPDNWVIFPKDINY